MKSITLTIPYERAALAAAADYFRTLADNLTNQQLPSPAAPEPAAEVPPAPEPVAAPEPEPAAEVPPAPEPEPAAESPASTGVELDADGLPWDHRIHSGAKSQTKDRRWKRLRGVSPELVAQVEAELRATLGAPAAAVPPAPPAAEQAPPAPPAAEQAPPAAPLPPDTVAPGPSPSVPEITFPALMQKLTQALAAQKVTQQQVNEYVQSLGVQSIPLLNLRPDLLPQVAAFLEQGA